MGYKDVDCIVTSLVPIRIIKSDHYSHHITIYGYHMFLMLHSLFSCYIAKLNGWISLFTIILYAKTTYMSD